MGIPEGSRGELLSAEQPASLPLPLCFPGTAVRDQGYPPSRGHQRRLHSTLPRDPSVPLVSCRSGPGALTALPRQLGREVVAPEGRHLHQKWIQTRHTDAESPGPGQALQRDRALVGMLSSPVGLCLKFALPSLSSAAGCGFSQLSSELSFPKALPQIMAIPVLSVC